MLAKKNHFHNQIDIFAPKAVHPTAERNHAFFGSGFVHQHMMMDKRWTPSDLMDQYANVTQLLQKRLVYQQLENKHTSKRLCNGQQELRGEVQDGRIKLQRALRGEAARKICRFLRNHKDLQRMFANLSIEQILEYTNTRTFKMRKERDRLSSHLEILKIRLKDKLIERENLETRIKYENEFVLQEQIKINRLQKNLCSSEIRMNTIKTINITYKKIIKVIRQDEIYFEPILAALNNDIENQQKFIQHILYLGYPVRDRRTEMTRECHQLDQKIRNEIQTNQQSIAKFKAASAHVHSPTVVNKNAPVKLLKHSYARETNDMKKLHDTLKEIELNVKLVEEVTLCTKPEFLCPTFKNQINCNNRLSKRIALDIIQLSQYSYKQQNSAQKKTHLNENFVRFGQLFGERIEKLKRNIAEEDERRKTTMEAIKRHSDIWVLLRFSLWNYFDILRHVEDNSRVTITKYPNTYLGLPWYNDGAVKNPPPKAFEENVFQIYNIVKHKLQRVIAVHEEEVNKLRLSIVGVNSNEKIAEHVHMYREKFLKFLFNDDISSDSTNYVPIKVDFGSSRLEHNIPNRKNIKDMAAKIVELNAKKDV